ncbi:MAG: alkaline phosphatase family protein, partial [Candidatus Cybelea sp.]
MTRGWNAVGLTLLVAASAGIAACAGGGSANGSYAPIPAKRVASSSSPIRHVIIVIQENRSFDNLFATFPGADGATTGEAEAVPVSEQSQCPIYHEETVNLTEGNLAVGDDFGHKYSDLQIDYDNANMDGFDVDPIPAGGGKIDCLHPYQYVNPAQIVPYWDIAEQYVLADHMYQTQGSGSFTAHQDLIAGGTAVTPTESIIDDPSGFPWGCDSPANTTTSLITIYGNYEPGKGPFPCFTQYETLRDRLDAAKISWKYYTEKVIPGKDTAGIWNAFDAISAVRYSAEWGKKVTANDKLIFQDISKGRLPAVSWVTPDALNSDHPQELK